MARFSKRTQEPDLKRAFEKYGFIEKIDIKEGRGFGFIVSTINKINNLIVTQS